MKTYGQIVALILSIILLSGSNIPIFSHEAMLNVEYDANIYNL